jgi:hypothetical protein
MILYQRLFKSEISHNIKLAYVKITDMARPRVTHGGDGLQISRVAANILNNQ